MAQSASTLDKIRRSRGFTVIEVMIVLAIVGMILLIVLLTLPSLRRNSRNLDRKSYASGLDAELNSYYNDNGHMPGAVGNPSTPANQAEICNFLKTLPRVDSAASCGSNTSSFTSTYGTTFSADCVTITAGPYTICYQNWLVVSHGYIGPNDEISIMLGHWCNVGPFSDPTKPSWYPVAGNDSNTAKYAIWTTLEGVNEPVCYG
jgi:prepilin-type N-terminal cleavage/methylation domain-containing protein